MDADEIVVHRMKRNCGGVVLNLFENAFVNRVKRRMRIRMVRLLRSTYDVLICLGPGLPSIGCFFAPMHLTPGLLGYCHFFFPKTGDFV